MHFQWSIYEEPLIRWDFYLNKINYKNENTLLEYLYKFMEILDLVGIYRMQTNDGYHYDLGVNYIDHAININKKEGKIMVFNINGYFLSASKRGKGEVFLCYEDTDGLKTDWVENIVEFQSKMAKDLGKEIYSGRPKAPLSIRGPILQNTDYTFPTGISLEIYSDIWFPWVLDQNSSTIFDEISKDFVDYYRPNGFDDLFDNRLLAQCNAPRLNHLIRLASELTQHYGEVIIERSGYIDTYYAPMVKPDGTIDLDVKPANGRPAEMYWLYE